MNSHPRPAPIGTRRLRDLVLTLSILFAFGSTALSLAASDGDPPDVIGITAPADGIYRAGQNLDFALMFSEAVTVTGTPVLALAIGSVTRDAAYLSGGGSSSILFRYTIQVGDNDSDGIVSSNALSLNSGIIQDAAGNDATLTINPPAMDGVLVDTVGSRFVGIDFDQSTGPSPTNWTQIVSSGQADYLRDESGRKTLLRFTNSPGATFFSGAIPAAETIPFSLNSLQDIGGNLYDFGTNATLTARLTGLKSGVTYKLWLFAVRAGGRTEQTVMIQGNGDPISFRQEGADTNLVVNDSVGSSTNDLASYAKLVPADSNGEIAVTIVADLQQSGLPLVVLAGLAIQGDIDLLPEINSPLEAAATNGVAFQYQITATGGTATNYDAIGLPDGLSIDSETGIISGIPTIAGWFNVMVSAANAFGDADTATLTIMIAKAIVTVELNNLSHVFDGTGQAATASTTPPALTVVLTYDGRLALPTNAGSYEVIGTVADANFEGAATNTLVISKAVAAMTLAGLSQVFDGMGQAATASTIPDGLTVLLTYDGSAALPTNAGSYEVIATVTDLNYIGTVTNILVITQGHATVTLTGLSHVFDGTGKAATAMTAPPNLFVYLTYADSSTLPTNAGSYEVIATVADTNYVGATTNTLVIEKATAVTTLAGLNPIYDGTGKAATASTIPPELTVELLYAGSSALPTNAGSYEVVATIVDTNYAGNATNTLVIAKASALVTLGALSQTYDGTARMVSATTTPPGLPVNFIYAGSALSPTNAGSYEVVGTINDLNYAGSGTNTLEVQQAPLSVTAENVSRRYGETNPVFSGTLIGAVVADQLSAIYSTTANPTSPAGLYPITPMLVDPAGKLENYAIALTNGVLTITSDDAPLILLATNRVVYVENADPVRLAVAALVTDGGSLDFGGGTLTVTLTTNNEAADLLSVRDEGLGAGEIGVNANEILFGGAVFGTWAGGIGTNALEFAFNTNATPLVVSALLQNLTFANDSELPSTNSRIAEIVITDGDGGTSAPASLTIEVVPLADPSLLTWANPAAIPYGTPLSGTQLDALANVPGNFLYSPPAGTVLNTGSNQMLTVVFTPDDLANYQMATSHVSLTVLKAPLTVTANDQTRNYANNNPPLTIRYDGFVHGDTLAVIDTPPTASTTATTNDNVGAYPITLAGGADDNYEINLVGGTLNVSTVPLLLVVNDASRLYGESNPTFTGTILQTRNGDTFNASYSTTATPTSPEGTYLITGTVLDRNNRLTNYTVTVTEGLLTIGKVVLTATANHLARPYGATNPPLTITYTGFLNGDDPSTLDEAPSASTTATTNSPLGDYPIPLSGGSDNRYTIVLVNGLLTVTKAPLTISADNLSKPFGGTNPPLSVTYAGLVNGETAVVLDTAPAIATTATKESPAGTYPIVLTGGSDDHYAITLANGTLTVLPSPAFGISLLSAPTTYLRRTPPVKLDPGATFNAGGRPHFGGGQLTATLVSNAVPGDLLAVYPQGTDANLVRLVGETIFIGDQPFGQMTRAAGPGQPLVFDLYSEATPSAVQGLVRQLSFVTTNNGLTSRVVELNLTDATGARSFPSRKTIVIDRVPAIPPFTGSVSNLARLPRGLFNGLILRTNDILPERSGYFRLTVKSDLAYSGFFIVGGRRTPFSGRFNENGHSAKLTALGAFGLELELVPETDQVRGTLTSYQGGGWSSELFGHRAPYSNDDPADPLKGAYTLALPGSEEPTIASVGNGYAAVKVDALGNVRFSGRLADGQIWNQNVLVSSNAFWPVCVSSQGGIIIGWLKLDGSSDGEVTGSLTWIKPRSSFYPNGFAAELAVSGSRFTPVTAAAPAVTWRNGELEIYGGNLLSPETNQITRARAATFVDSAGPIRQLRIVINPENGVFHGQFVHPLSLRATSYFGVLLQNRDMGTGFFLGLNQGGLVRLTAATEEP